MHSRLLNSLQAAFSGKPQSMGDAVGVMHELKNLAQELIRQPFDAGPYAGQYAGPCFRYRQTA